MQAEILQEAVIQLTRPSLPISQAANSVPSVPGLYAFHGGTEVWTQLQLGIPPDGRPLYVGKSEDSLLSRDVRTHSGTGKTGSSTLRRSFAALWASDLNLVAQPRNPLKPAYFANYGLEPDGDARLTAWMEEHLTLSVWPNVQGVVLDELETAVLVQLQPPLNLNKVRPPWKEDVSQARRRLANDARRWPQLSISPQ